MMFNPIVRKKLTIKTARDEFTTASVVARPTPTAPSRAVRPFWQLINTINSAKTHALVIAMMMSLGRVQRTMFAT